VPTPTATPGFDGERLRQLREAAGLSRAQLAVASNCGVDTIGGLERGRWTNPTLDTTFRIAEALQVDFDQLLIRPTETV
jgi:transcriptional regulator with XRE-family HTH domain